MSLPDDHIDYYARILSHSQLFHGIAEPALKSMITAGKIQKVSHGTEILKEGAQVAGLHVVLEGAAKVKKGEAVLVTLGRGAFFGEISLFGAALGATASIVAQENCTTLLITSEVLRTWSKQFPDSERDFLRKLCTELCRRLSLTSERAS